MAASQKKPAATRRSKAGSKDDGAGKSADKPAAKPNGNGAAPPADVDPKELLDFYREMLLIRRFEERAGQLYGMGLIGGFCHPLGDASGASDG